MSIESGKSGTKINLLIFAAFTFCLAAAGVFLVSHFIQLNFEGIIHPEVSPGFSESTPFGDGGDVWREFGIYIPNSIFAFLVLFNLAGVFCCLLPPSVKWYILSFFAIILTVLTFFIVSDPCHNVILLHKFFGTISFLLVLPGLFLNPLGIILAEVLFVKHKRILSGHIALLTLSLILSSMLEWFSVYLYLD